MISISALLNGCCPTKSPPYPGSAFHGGMIRLLVTSAIRLARDFTLSYVSRPNGAGPEGEWHPAHFSKTIGAISLANVTGAFDDWFTARADTAPMPTTTVAATTALADATARRVRFIGDWRTLSLFLTERPRRGGRTPDSCAPMR